MRSVKLILSVIGLGLCFVTWLAAEDENVEEKKWGGDVALSLALAKGNTDTTNFSLTFSAEGPISESVINTNKGFFLLAKDRDKTTAESMRLESRIEWQHKERLFSYYEIQGLRDRFKNYSYRFLPAVGIGYKVVAMDKLHLSATAGISEVFTKYHDSGATDTYTGIVFGDKFAWKISDAAELTQIFDVNANFSDFSQYFIRFEVNLVTTIAAGWAVNLTFMDNYDNKPEGEGIKKNDMVFLAGLSLKFGSTEE